MRKTIRRLSFLTAGAACLPLVPLLSPERVFAQAPAAAVLSFEVATIKPGRTDDANSNVNFGTDRVTTQNVRLIFLLKEAYGLNKGSDDQIVGAPEWVREMPFDINAKMDGPTAASLDKMSGEERERAIDAMLRALLQERFQLKIHTEDQPRSVLALVPVKGGLKLIPFPSCPDQAADHPCEPTGWQGLHNDGQGHVEGRGATAAMLTSALSTQRDIGGRMVIDGTGVTGKFSFDLHYTPDGSAAENAGPSLFSALQEQLGLKLETKKVPVKVLVIDQVEHPSAN